jgi:hypothetical protein
MSPFMANPRVAWIVTRTNGENRIEARGASHEHRESPGPWEKPPRSNPDGA